MGRCEGRRGATGEQRKGPRSASCTEVTVLCSQSCCPTAPGCLFCSCCSLPLSEMLLAPCGPPSSSPARPQLDPAPFTPHLHLLRSPAPGGAGRSRPAALPGQQSRSCCIRQPSPHHHHLAPPRGHGVLQGSTSEVGARPPPLAPAQRQQKHRSPQPSRSRSHGMRFEKPPPAPQAPPASSSPNGDWRRDISQQGQKLLQSLRPLEQAL